MALAILVGFSIVLFCLLIGHSAIKAPYSWPDWLNTLYFCTSRWIYVGAVMLILFSIFTGANEIFKVFLSRPLFLVMGKLSFEACLITPLMVQIIYSTQAEGVFVSFNKVLELGIGNVFCVLIGAFFIYIVFEFPIKRLVQMTCNKKLNHDEVYHLRFLRQKTVGSKGDFIDFASGRGKTPREMRIDEQQKESYESVPSSPMLFNRESNDLSMSQSHEKLQ